MTIWSRKHKRTTPSQAFTETSFRQLDSKSQTVTHITIRFCAKLMWASYMWTRTGLKFTRPLSVGFLYVCYIERTMNDRGLWNFETRTVTPFLVHTCMYTTRCLITGTVFKYLGHSFYISFIEKNKNSIKNYLRLCTTLLSNIYFSCVGTIKSLFKSQIYERACIYCFW